ncbi:MAG: DUF1385 domain-containing protein [Oscillospiraceae bacterium]|nr:DUF1385 domain-containing protein [Oscillospiraceae bacterium]
MAKNEEAGCSFRTSIGGQAILEGILMRGPEKTAIVVRKEDGTFAVKESPNQQIKDKYPVLGWPIIRGTVNFIESMVTGVKAINYSSEQLLSGEEAEKDKLDLWLEKKLGSEKATKVATAVAVVLAVLLSVGLFILLPTFLVGLLGGVIKSALLLNLCEGVLRIIIFLTYIWLCSRLKDIKRVWMYHGAEHKTIHCYEKGLPLTVENCREQKRNHPRCGTSFMFIVMIISILVFALVRWRSALVRMALRLVLLSVVVGISYELIKLAGRHDNWFTRAISAPGRWLQGITTAEPDDSMLEVAIKALELVIPEQQGSDAW